MYWPLQAADHQNVLLSVHQWNKKESMPVCTPLEILPGSPEQQRHLGNRYTKTTGSAVK